MVSVETRNLERQYCNEGIDEANNDLDELEFLQIRLRPKAAFRRPPSPPSPQQCEMTLHSSQSQIGDDRGTIP